ncbi:hypothetical protein, partial [Sphingomonas sp. BAUL-RG-20F-R05-02]|uniref:hypothetical protein n=1 Tax=Sphingomonas sp. BAUL-RG-20F-R05-02 TaxID=2914830 RepID=UPI001F565F9D
LVLIFLKYHFKDRLLRWHLDRRKGDEKIAARYSGELFHHLHAVARAHHTGALLDDGVVGTLIVMSREEGSILNEGRFDAATVTDGWTIYLQIEEVHVFAVLNDAGASASALSQILDAIDGPLSSLQARELAAELAAANQHLENPPRFRTDVAAGPTETVMIRALREESGPRFADRDADLIGEIKTQLLGRYFGHIEAMTAEQVEREVRKDHYTFLLDAEGQFLRHGAAN